MTVISIIGPPGVGKSTLVRQLACLNCSPAFFEGEEGIFTKEVLDVLNNEIDSEERYDWLTERFKSNLEKAHEISKQGIDVYVDGDVTTFEAWLEAEIGDKSPEYLRNWLKNNQHLKADIIIVLTASENKIKENINKRGRTSELNSFIINRSMRVHKGCINLSKKYPNALLIDRTNIDFMDENQIREIDKMIKNFKKTFINPS